MTSGQPLTIEFSNRKRVFGLTICAFAFFYCVWLVINDTAASQFDQYMAWSGVIVLGPVCVGLLQMILLGSKIGLHLTKTGLTSATYSQDEVPWRFIVDVRLVKARGSRYVFAELSPDAGGKIRRNRLYRILNWPEFGPPGIYLNSGPFQLSTDQLYTTLRNHWMAAGAAPIRPAGSKPSAGE